MRARPRGQSLPSMGRAGWRLQPWARSVDRGTCGRGIEPRKYDFRKPTWSRVAEGNSGVRVNCECTPLPARSEALSTQGSSMAENREIPRSPTEVGRTGKTEGRKPVMHERGKSDRPVVPRNSPNKAERPAAEAGEGRGLAEGNPRQTAVGRTQMRSEPAKSGLDRVREIDSLVSTRGRSPVR